MRICKVENCGKKHKAKGYCAGHCSQIWRCGKILKRTRATLNEIIDCDGYYEICLYNIKHQEIARVKIDKEDLYKVKQYKWHLNNNGYARYKNIDLNLYLHNLILGKKDGYFTDHINHDILDNRKQNLRLVTPGQNSMNNKGKGVYWHKKNKNWIASIGLNRKNIHLGSFEIKKDALKARKAAEKKYFKEFAYEHRGKIKENNTGNEKQ